MILRIKGWIHHWCNAGEDTEEPEWSTLERVIEEEDTENKVLSDMSLYEAMHEAMLIDLEIEYKLRKEEELRQWEERFRDSSSRTQRAISNLWDEHNQRVEALKRETEHYINGIDDSNFRHYLVKEYCHNIPIMAGSYSMSLVDPKKVNINYIEL